MILGSRVAGLRTAITRWEREEHRQRGNPSSDDGLPTDGRPIPATLAPRWEHRKSGQVRRVGLQGLVGAAPTVMRY